MRSIIYSLSFFALAACADAAKEDQALAPATSAPIGLWVWSAEAPDADFSIQLERSEGSWRATIQSKSANVQFIGKEITIGDKDGHFFSGRWNERSTQIAGYWYQPSSDLAYLPMVTKTILTSNGEDAWIGNVETQPRPFRVFLDVFDDQGAGVRAVIRNPERNEIMGWTEFKLESESSGRWSLVAGLNERQNRYSLRQTGDQGLELDHDWFPDPLPLKPATDEDALHYYSRPVGSAASYYQTPPQLDDGWKTISAKRAGYDQAKLDALIAELANADPRDRRPRLVHSLLVSHKGRLVVEEYFFGFDRETRHDTRSMAKVFGTVLVGALQNDGVEISTLDRPIPALLDAAGEPLGDDRKADVTLAHLMTFSSGLDCDAASPNSAGSEMRMWNQQEESDYWLFTARLPILNHPGEHYGYCSGSINLVGARLREAGEAKIHESFDRLIAEPMQFGPYHWNLAPNGAAYLGGGVYMRPRDILKIGAMHSAGGVWDGQQILTEDWVVLSTSPKIDISPETTGLSLEAFGDYYFGGQQAFVWRNDTIIANGQTYASYEATGNGGQILLVVPELELAVVLTGGNYRWGGIWGRWRDEIVGDHIIPAIIP